MKWKRVVNLIKSALEDTFNRLCLCYLDSPALTFLISRYLFVLSEREKEPPWMCYSIAPLLVDFMSLRHFIADFIPVLTSVQQIPATSEKFTGSI